MTRKELANEVSKSIGISNQVAENTIESTIGVIKDFVKRDDEVTLRGFGTFGLKSRKAKLGRNPRTGEPVNIPEKKVPYFKPSPEFKNLVK